MPVSVIENDFLCLELVISGRPCDDAVEFSGACVSILGFDDAV